MHLNTEQEHQWKENTLTTNVIDMHGSVFKSVIEVSKCIVNKVHAIYPKEEIITVKNNIQYLLLCVNCTSQTKLNYLFSL